MRRGWVKQKKIIKVDREEYKQSNKSMSSRKKKYLCLNHGKTQKGGNTTIVLLQF